MAIIYASKKVRVQICLKLGITFDPIRLAILIVVVPYRHRLDFKPKMSYALYIHSMSSSKDRDFAGLDEDTIIHKLIS